MDALLPWLRRTGWAYVAVVIALALVSWRMLAGDGARQGPGAVPVTATQAMPVEATAAERSPVVVHVAGEVRRPGVYVLSEGDRVQRAVARAGGPRRRADLSALNLAAPVQDGQQIVVPSRVPPGANEAGPSAPASTAGPLSLSRATAEELDALDGIGPTLAGRIIEWRTRNGGFASVDQLLEVQGIGPTRLEALRPHVVP
jgi:competence protein ComEA